MTKLIVVLDATGKFDALLTNSEVDVEVLTRGKDDEKIDIAESCYEQVEQI